MTAMKLPFTLGAAALWLLASLPAGAQGDRLRALGESSTDVDMVIAYERELWEAWKNRDFRIIERLTAIDYYSVDEYGPGEAVGLTWLRDNFASFNLHDYRIGEIVGRVLAPDVIALVYNAHIVGSFEGKDINRGVSEASIWVKRDSVWLNVLLHEITRPNRDHTVDP